MQQTQLLSQPHRLPACVLVTAKRPIWRVSSTSSKRLQRVPYISSSINHSGLTPGRSKVTAGAAASASLWDHGRQRTKLFDTAFDKEIAQVALPALVSMLLEVSFGLEGVMSCCASWFFCGCHANRACVINPVSDPLTPPCAPAACDGCHQLG
jgi:hypothetical protein